MTDHALHDLSEVILAAFNSPAAHRERIATQIVTGLLGDESRRLDPERAARQAVEYADALIEELQRERDG